MDFEQRLRIQSRPQVTLVLPCLNEAESIGACIDEAILAMAPSGLAFEVVVVDNGSTDGSDRIAAEHGARVIIEEIRGYGAAVQRGIHEALGEIVVMADADQTYDLRALPALIEGVLADDFDIVMGERLSTATGDTMPFLHRWLGTPAITWLLRRVVPNLELRDSQSGYRAFRRERIVELGLHSPGMEFASEMIVQAARRGYRINEIPIGYRQRVGESKLSTFRDGLRHLRMILLLAPQLVLRVPGLAILAVGLASMVAGVMSPAGVRIGSARWQPIFFSTILVVVGTVSLIAAAAIVRLSPIAHRGDHRVRRINRLLGPGGTALLSAGSAIDVILNRMSPSNSQTLANRTAWAGVATTAIIVGVLLIATTVVGSLILGHEAYVRRSEAITERDSRAIDLRGEDIIAA
jgi:glycosyl transferase family 2